MAAAMRHLAISIAVAIISTTSFSWAQDDEPIDGEGAEAESAASDASEEGTKPSTSDDTIGDDEVTLKSGGAVRGTIISHDPGERVVIKVYGDDEPRIIPWAEVADVQMGKHAKAADAPAPMPSVPEPETAVEPAGQAAGNVTLHIESEDPNVTLFEVVGGGTVASGNRVAVFGVSKPVCTNPCDKVVDGSQGTQFYFAGDGVTASDHFSLAGREGDVTARVDPGSAGLRTGGYVLSYVGGVVLLAGTLLTAFAFTILDDPSTGDVADPLKVAGPVGLGTGAAMLGAGIPMMVVSGTDYEIEEGAAVAFDPKTLGLRF